MTDTASITPALTTEHTHDFNVAVFPKVLPEPLVGLLEPLDLMWFACACGEPMPGVPPYIGDLLGIPVPPDDPRRILRGKWPLPEDTR